MGKLFKPRQLAAMVASAILIIGFLPSKASAITSNSPFSDPWMQQWLPQPGGPVSSSSSPFSSPSLPSTTGAASTPNLAPANMTSAVGSSAKAPQSSPLPDVPVSIPQGGVDLPQTDLTLSSFALPIQVTREYKTEQKDTLSPFGYGWTFPYAHSLQMYSGFDMTEYLPDGSHTNYSYTKDYPNDPSIMVSQYDGDSSIYYPLDKGYYTAQSGALSSLKRVSQSDYEVTEISGQTYVFSGYKAAWRTGADPTAGKLLKVIDRHGNVDQLTYDSQGNLTQVQDPSGRTVKFDYTGSLVRSMTDPLGRKTTYTYTANELTKVTHPDGTVDTYTYDSNHNLVSDTASKTGAENFVFTGNRVTEIDQNGNLLYRYTYKDDVKQIVREDALGNLTTYTYNNDRRITGISDASGTYGMTYNGNGQVTEMSGPQGTAEYQYDAFQNPISETNAYGQTLHFSYDPTLHLPTSLTDSYGRTWSMQYDATGDMTSTVNPLSQTDTFSYNPQGQVLSHNARGQQTTKYDYDKYGQLYHVTDALGNSTTYTYDAGGRLTRVDYPNGDWRKVIYANGDNPIEIDEASGLRIKLTYNSQGLLSEVLSSTGSKVEYKYDPFGRMTEQTDANGNTTT